MTFMTARLMFGLVDQGLLLRDMKKIMTLARQYPRCWGIVYQADVRMRCDRMIIVKEELEE